MFSIVLQIFGGACVGFLGAEAGRIAFNGVTKSLTRPELNTALRYRALLLGGIIAGGPTMMVTLGAAGEFSRTFGIVCLGASLVLTLLYAVGWLHFVTTYGQKPVESGELVFLVAMLPFAFLYVCGILWITLGTVLVLGAAGYGGLYFYRARVRARAR